MTFKTNQQEFNEVLAEAKNRMEKGGLAPGTVAVVTISKVSPEARKCWYGFHFEEAGAVSVGDVVNLLDGSVRRVEAMTAPIPRRLKGDTFSKYCQRLGLNPLEIWGDANGYFAALSPGDVPKTADFTQVSNIPGGYEVRLSVADELNEVITKGYFFK